MAQHQDDICVSTLAEHALSHLLWLQGTPLTTLSERLHKQQLRSKRLGSKRLGASLDDSIGYLLRQLCDSTSEPPPSPAADEENRLTTGPITEVDAENLDGWPLLAHCTAAFLLDERTRWPRLLHAADGLDAALPGQFAQVELTLFTLLMRAELARNAGRASRGQLLLQGEHDLCRLDITGQSGNLDIQTRFHLAAAEMAALYADTERAMDHFEQALACAEKQATLHLQALACERYGLFWQRQNRHALSRPLLHKATTRYLQWGATRKAAQLSTGFPSD